ncbi:MAG TPA: tryptophan synthase subunit alpha [Thermoplasmata archaeon]|nr:tryptophan synthase subunit alpha [Thermoplasmata archaeon]
MTRIARAFERARIGHRAALITYLMAGDPDLRRTDALALACEAGGADILELGIPFSDPIADGPEIGEAGQRSLRGGTRPGDVLSLAASLRTRTEIPLVVMTYLNPVLAMGVEAFAERVADAGVDGLLIPDVSSQISDELRDALDRAGVDHVQLVAPATPPDRATAIARASRGFLYVVARHGTTGIRSKLPEDIENRIASLHRVTNLPLGVGFGVSTRDHVRTLASWGADGIVVGSAIVRFAAENPDPDRLRDFVADLAAGLPQAAASRVDRSNDP